MRIFPPFETICDLRTPRAVEILKRRRYGVIEVERGRLVSVRFMPIPKLVTWFDARLIGPRRHARNGGDRCRLFFNQPTRFPWALALVYVESSRDCRFSTFRGAVRLLDEIARVKQVDALLCDASNQKISDRLLRRWGWESHAPSRFHRNFIKRLYGNYPEPLPETSPLLAAWAEGKPTLARIATSPAWNCYQTIAGQRIN